MRSHQDWFDSQIIFLKIISMQPLRFSFLPPRLNFLEKILNLLFGLFWHFIVIHLGIFQTVTIILNLDKTLDEIMDYVLIGSIYIYGYSILCFYQYNWEKLLKLVDFVNQNFHHRSAKGKFVSFKFLLNSVLSVAYTLRLNVCFYQRDCKSFEKVRLCLVVCLSWR